MKVTLRQRLKGKKIVLYLDYYHKGYRKYEHLGLYLYPQPEKGRLTKEQRLHNKETLRLAENIRAKKQLEFQNEIYGFGNTQKLNANFIEYYEHLAELRRNSENNYGNWLSALKHLKRFAGDNVAFKDITVQWLENFKYYLQYEAKGRYGKPLSRNTQNSYFNKVRAALNQAEREGIIVKNPVKQVRGISAEDPQREFLTLEELKKLKATDCKVPILKQAFLFSCLTGLRWSDVSNLTWGQIQHSQEAGYYIRFRQRKTGAAETLPISEAALQFLGERRGDDDKVFVDLKYSRDLNRKLQEWVRAAGINKKITFHCARHTFATLQITLGTDIYTLSKMLGHKNIKNTQIYAKIVNEKKREAANKMKL